MFFAASKIFWLIAEPVSLVMFVGVLGIVFLYTRFARAGRALMASAIIALAIGMLTPIGAMILRPLEDRFPTPAADMPAPDGIIVLGGAVDTPKSEARRQVWLNADAARMTSGVELARRYPNARLIYTGGSAGFPEGGPAEAISARELWLSLGVPAERMMFEAKSRNTFENAVFTRELVKPKPGETWLLVTSAWHMPRSVGIFRRAGFPVVPYPVAYRTFGDERDFQMTAPALDKLSMLECGVREWIGLLAYRLSGKTDALFPAPRPDIARD
ncbi:YdcF family protein [Methylocapsa sp. D3K7]|uniref:YdcF family protein n=1 Tax=Methylocapsa sp. D3K7 TaxID=3041435 RepID=UPI00244EE8D6|nr:YdcF family protein [Methylocapsa sp. D3K7]WGJ15117.1 YdcF family protein [Methylocapsa sp. D3K7]